MGYRHELKSFNNIICIRLINVPIVNTYKLGTNLKLISKKLSVTFIMVE